MNEYGWERLQTEVGKELNAAAGLGLEIFTERKDALSQNMTTNCPVSKCPVALVRKNM